VKARPVKAHQQEQKANFTRLGCREFTMARRQAMASFKCPSGAEAGFTLISMS
jgi:hypothetical protein